MWSSACWISEVAASSKKKLRRAVAPIKIFESSWPETSRAMAANPGRAAFRMLMRARASAFKGDTFALRESAQKLREEFLKNKDVSDAAAIGECVTRARASARAEWARA